MKFAYMELKIGLVKMLKKFQILPSSKTPKKLVVDEGVGMLVPRLLVTAPLLQRAPSRRRTKTVRWYFAVSTTPRAGALKGASAYLGTKGNGLPTPPRPLEKGGRRGTEKDRDRVRAL